MNEASATPEANYNSNPGLRCILKEGQTMLEIKPAVVSIDEQEVLELERIVTDADEKEALAFLKKTVYARISSSQQGQLKSHLESVKPTESFIQHRLRL